MLLMKFSDSALESFRIFLIITISLLICTVYLNVKIVDYHVPPWFNRSFINEKELGYLKVWSGVSYHQAQSNPFLSAFMYPPVLGMNKV